LKVPEIAKKRSAANLCRHGAFILQWPERRLGASWRQEDGAAMKPARPIGRTGLLSLPRIAGPRQSAAIAIRDRIRTMISAPAALAALRGEAASCRRCHLWANATQTVFGEGPADSDLVFVGEQPGDKEDIAGRPFVGPAGAILDRAMAEVGIDRKSVYVTNAVKHFKNELHGKRRLHKKPNAVEIDRCRWWLEREASLLSPKLTVALGATALRSLLGEETTIAGARGKVLPSAFAGPVFVTIHPSVMLRLPDEDLRRREYAAFVRDLEAVRRIVLDASASRRLEHEGPK
jgi:DNA polymerase